MVGIALKIKSPPEAWKPTGSLTCFATRPLPTCSSSALACKMIDQTFREIDNDNEVALLIVDPSGYCTVAAETQRNILALWTQLVAAPRIAQPHAAGSPKATLAQPPTPFMTSGTVPPSSIHLDGAFPEVTAKSSFGAETTQP